jgi:hypothetical protein
MPFNLAGIHIDPSVPDTILVIGFVRVEDALCLTIDGFCKTENGIGVDIRYITKYGMAINTYICVRK